jgi:hypothetical protein
MLMRIRPRVWLMLALAAASGAPDALGVIFYATGDPTYNTTAPSGSLAGSGWQWVGAWGAYEGTPIAPHHFITSQHVGGTVGDPFVYGGVSYTTTAFFDDASTDLRICEVNGTFPSWAPLYRQSSEVGNGLVVIGRGDSKGTEVMVDGALKGWMWGGNSGPMRWGQNTVGAVLTVPIWGPLIYAPFQSGAGPNDADLAIGDSSSPIFINDGTGWKLAGVAAVVDGPFNTTSSGGGFNAAIFDSSGLYVQEDNGDWVLVPGPGPVPTGFYGTRISARAPWIDSVIPPWGNFGDTPALSGGQTAILAAAIAVVGALCAARRAPTKGSA